jgi:hypothetical protein
MNSVAFFNASSRCLPRSSSSHGYVGGSGEWKVDPRSIRRISISHTTTIQLLLPPSELVTGSRRYDLVGLLWSADDLTLHLTSCTFVCMVI